MHLNAKSLNRNFPLSLTSLWGKHKLTTRASFGSTYTKMGTIQRRLAWPLRKDDTQIREAFHIFFYFGNLQLSYLRTVCKFIPFKIIFL